MKQLILVLVIAAVLLALPALQRKSLGGFLVALFYAAFGIVLPLFVFFFSAFLIPEWKGAALHGWVDCFHLGKLALTPMVLWATTAFYAEEIYQVEDWAHPRIVLGYFLGAITSIVCLIFGLFCVSFRDGGFLWMLVPIYVAVWYSARAAYLMSKARIKPRTYGVAILGSLPLWFWSVLWTRKIYEGLPDQAPSCFVVTAATRGHRRLVGPFFEITRGNRKRIANRQLLTFWQFEDAWHRHSPTSHAIFRRIYNRWGPIVARRITRAWMADVIYLAIKPVEFAAAICGGIEWRIFKHDRAKEVGGPVIGEKMCKEGGL